ncbi:ArsR family transcriptional regulator [Arachnia propionica]
MHADKPVIDSPTPEHIDLAVAVFSMLAEPTRVRIILALQDRELSVGQIA